MESLVHCIGRGSVGGEGPLVFGKVWFLRYVGMSVGVAVNFVGTRVFLTVAFSFNFIFG